MKIKHRLSLLNKRERLSLLVLFVFLALCSLFYIRQSLDQSILAYQEDIAYQRDIIQFMQRNRSALNSSSSLPTLKKSESRFATIEQTFKQNRFKNSNMQIQTLNQQQVMVTLSNVLYSDVMLTLQQLRELGIMVIQFDAQKMEPPGVINTRMILQ